GRQRRAVLPRHLELPRGLDRIPLALRHDADKAALAYDTGAGNVGDRAFIDAERLGARAVGALAARAHDAPMQHAGNAHVLHVLVGAGGLGRQVDPRHVGADQRIAADRLLRGYAGELDVERLVAEEIAVAHGAGRVAVDRHHALRYDQA